MIFHVVYPYDPSRDAAPWSIGNHLVEALRARGDVRVYDWASRVIPEPVTRHDVLIGHPHPESGRAFGGALTKDWARKIAITPWGGRVLTEALVDDCMPYVDKVALICGPYWAERIPARWRFKSLAVDMAIDASRFPRVKEEFNPPGQRGYLYIGCTEPCKGTDYLERLISMVPGRWGHFGPGRVHGAIEHGYAAFWDDAALSIVKEYDFLVHCGRNDANPTTVLEAACWGLIPLCTPTSGWGEDVSVALCGKNPTAAAEDLGYWQDINPADLEHASAALRHNAKTYTWDRFTSKILSLL